MKINLILLDKLFIYVSSNNQVLMFYVLALKTTHYLGVEY